MGVLSCQQINSWSSSSIRYTGVYIDPSDRPTFRNIGGRSVYCSTLEELYVESIFSSVIFGPTYFLLLCISDRHMETN